MDDKLLVERASELQLAWDLIGEVPRFQGINLKPTANLNTNFLRRQAFSLFQINATNVFL